MVQNEWYNVNTDSQRRVVLWSVNDNDDDDNDDNDDNDYNVDNDNPPKKEREPAKEKGSHHKAECNKGL